MSCFGDFLFVAAYNWKWECWLMVLLLLYNNTGMWLMSQAPPWNQTGKTMGLVSGNVRKRTRCFFVFRYWREASLCVNCLRNYIFLPLRRFWIVMRNFSSFCVNVRFGDFELSQPVREASKVWALAIFYCILFSLFICNLLLFRRVIWKL